MVKKEQITNNIYWDLGEQLGLDLLENIAHDSNIIQSKNFRPYNHKDMESLIFNQIVKQAFKYGKKK